MSISIKDELNDILVSKLREIIIKNELVTEKELEKICELVKNNKITSTNIIDVFSKEKKE